MAGKMCKAIDCAVAEYRDDGTAQRVAVRIRALNLDAIIRGLKP